MKLSAKLALCSALSLGLLGMHVHAEHAWGNYHWARTTDTFTLKVIDSVTPDWDGSFDNTLAVWSFSEVLELSLVSADDSSKTRQQCRMATGQIRVCNNKYGFNGWLGLATIGIDSRGHIDRGTAKMNDSYASYWAIEGEKNHVICQEVGHLFGLGHTTEDGSSQGTCMDYSSDPASQWPNLHDFDMLLAIYGSHLDGYNSYAGSTSGGGTGGGCTGPGKSCNGAAAALDTDPAMGIRIAGNRYEEIWVARRNDGGLWIHHLRLAP